MTVHAVNVPRPVDVVAVGADATATGPRLVPANGTVAIGPTGFADPSAKDALSHALYAYPTAHHAFWRTVRAQARVTTGEQPLPAAVFDEHLALNGIEESQLWVGDLLRFPGCTLVVSVPRLPDERFNQTLGFAHAAKMVAQSRWSGFWLAVRVPGFLAAGDPFELVPGPRATALVELFRARIKGRSD